MIEQDIATRRARDLERYHRRTAERKAKGLCLKCGKRPPAPHRSQCEPCIEKRRRADLACHHRRTAERAARGLCPKCGKQPPATGRTLCEACNEKRNRASRARDARLRAAGMTRRDPERARAYERERSRRETGQRRAAGLCLHCGKAPALEGRTTCEPCGEQRRARERTRYAKAKAEGKLYGGRKVETRRRIGRERSRKRDEVRSAAGLCMSCGKRPPADGGATCESCREAKRAAERALYASRRAAGWCGSCGGPTTDGGSRCAPCAVAETARYPSKNAARREQYATRAGIPGAPSRPRSTRGKPRRCRRARRACVCAPRPTARSASAYPSDPPSSTPAPCERLAALDATAKQAVCVTVFGREADCERAGNYVTRPSDAMDRGHEIDGGGHREHERERDSNRIDRKAHGERERKHRSERDASERRVGK